LHHRFFTCEANSQLSDPAATECDLQLGKDARQEAFRVALQRLFDAHKFNSIDSGGKGCGHWSIVQSMARSVHASRVTHSSREGATPAARCLPTNGAAAFRVGRPSTK